MQNRYWNQLTQYKFALYYLDAHFSRCVKIDRTIKIILALTSSASIASWVIWSKFSFLWAIIIAVSQVVSVVNEFLPYKKRVIDISDMKAKLTSLYYCAEHDWYKVASGDLTEAEINDLNYDYLKQWEEIDGKYFIADALPIIKKCSDIAQRKKNAYYETMFRRV